MTQRVNTEAAAARQSGVNVKWSGIAGPVILKTV